MPNTATLLAACKAQHEAIDILFAMMIELTSSGCVPTEVFYPSKSGQPWEALKQGNEAIKAAEVAAEEPQSEYAFDQVEAAACMWEHVLAQLRRGREPTLWGEYAAAYGMVELRQRVIRHAPVLEAAYVRAVANGYDKAFDWEFVPKYMEDHVTRVLT